MSAAILNDTTRCVGCGACALACKEINHLPGGPPRRLDANTWTFVERRGGVFVRRMCMHCEEPTCGSVCPVAAFYRTETGAVNYDADKCIGCRYCIMACPFDIPKYQWDKQLPITQKCVMCYEKRLRQGEQPACTQVCPAGATLFGDRDALIAEARRRIERNPERYVDHIYGLREAGGTSVLYLSSVPFERLGFPTGVIERPYPELTWAIISQVPRVFTLGGALLFGTTWVINRRIENARQAAAAAGRDGREEE
ncbi:MAG: 4Fe-4S dicluster domain-containing protein [Armatimonadetes bacterium]|nr:4Fe-4S dicluster domain-containing protein [Armatimonadota bacterium]